MTTTYKQAHHFYYIIFWLCESFFNTLGYRNASYKCVFNTVVY